MLNLLTAVDYSSHTLVDTALPWWIIGVAVAAGLGFMIIGGVIASKREPKYVLGTADTESYYKAVPFATPVTKAAMATAFIIGALLLIGSVVTSVVCGQTYSDEQADGIVDWLDDGYGIDVDRGDVGELRSGWDVEPTVTVKYEGQFIDIALKEIAGDNIIVVKSDGIGTENMTPLAPVQ